MTCEVRTSRFSPFDRRAERESPQMKPRTTYASPGGQVSRMAGEAGGLRFVGDRPAIPSTSTRANAPCQGATTEVGAAGEDSGPLTRCDRANARSTGWRKPLLVGGPPQEQKQDRSPGLLPRKQPQTTTVDNSRCPFPIVNVAGSAACRQTTAGNRRT
jgi:hypothetical protein